MSLSNLFFYSKYNNYYNRLVKFEENIDDYPSFTTFISSVNFNPNDGVDATQTLNYEVSIEGVDYCVVTNEYNDIVSRWFVIEAVRTRNGQYTITLRRDVIADYYNIIIQSPIFIEKAMVNSGSPLIYNSENMTYNQIKTSQTPLYDGSNTSWIVMYVSNKYYDNMEGSYKEESTPITIDANSITRTKFEIEQQYKTNQTDTFISGSENVRIRIINTQRRIVYIHDFNSNGGHTVSQDTNLSSNNGLSLNVQNVANVVRDFDFGTIFNITGDAIALNGALCKQGNDVYRIKVEQYEYTKTSTQNTSTGLGLAIAPYVTNFQGTFAVSHTGIKQVITFELINPTLTAGFNIAKNNRMCKDAPYRILYAKNENLTLDNGQDATIQVSMQQLMTNLATKIGEFVYDVQILPYCPDEDVRVNNFPYNRDLGGSRVNKLVVNFPSTTEAYFLLYVAEASSFKLFIPHEIEAPSSALELKVANECDMYRICSPNGSGGFDFSVAKNRGVQGFNVECTYKPVNPYINVCPRFGGLYGRDFQDYRGLICQGDFSLPLINDQWISYEQNNKNYLNIFNREMESLELHQKWEKINSIGNAIIGTATGAAAGGAAGSIWSGAGGAGAAIGGVLSAAAGTVDVIAGQKIRDDAKDLKQDMFGYSLGNIQARPTTLAKTGCITIDNVYVPYIEYYTCTEEEKEALRNKIKYNGMSVGVIGKIEDYVQDDYSYVKGQLIRCEGISDDFHVINEIGSELSKGVYIK